jgi:hypothetical protein
MIDFVVNLSARPRILSGPSISVTVDPVGLLGITGTNSRTGDTSAVVDMTGTLTGGLDVMYGDISFVADPVASRTIGWVESAPLSYGWYTEDGNWNNPWQYIIHQVPVAYYDQDYDPPLLDYAMSVSVSDSVSVQGVPGVTIPAPPAPAPPAPPEAPGDFPMPVAGGVVVRAQYGIVVDMDTPTITDGMPSS